MKPIIDWVKNDPDKHQWFSDGSTFLVALQVRDEKSGKLNWEYDCVSVDCSGNGISLVYRGTSDPYDAWSWDDFEYFALLDGDMPATRPE